METNVVWELLSNLSVGTVMAWILGICAIIAVLCTGTIKLYKLFSKYKQLKDEDIRQHDLLAEHEKILNEIKESIKRIEEANEMQKEVDLKVIRHLIVNSCEEALAHGFITENQLKALEEMFEEYTHVFNGNGYVKGLMIRVRKLMLGGE